MSRSRLEEEWAEHHRREQRELEIINTQQIHCKWVLGAAYGNLRHQRTKEREMFLTKSKIYIIKTRRTSTVLGKYSLSWSHTEGSRIQKRISGMKERDATIYH